MKTSIESYKELELFLRSVETSFSVDLSGGVYLRFSNSGKRGDTKSFNFGLKEVLSALNDIKSHRNEFAAESEYEEKAWRDLGGKYFVDEVASSFITVQTKPVFGLLAKIIHWANDFDIHSYSDNKINLSPAALDKAITTVEALVVSLAPEALALERETNKPERAFLANNFDLSKFREDFEIAINETRFIQTQQGI